MADSKGSKKPAGAAQKSAGSVRKKAPAGAKSRAATAARKTATGNSTAAAAKPAGTLTGLPTAAELKDKFKAGSIPLQSDFAALIDLANSGAAATGQLDGKPGPGLTLSSSGLLEVKAGSGIKVGADGVSLDPYAVLPKGAIIMFSGDKVPEGWALCDGNDGTPDLIDRFILGGNLSEKGSNDAKIAGKENSKTYRKSTSLENVPVSVKVNGTNLTIDQIPEHAHITAPGFLDLMVYSDAFLYGGNKIDSHGQDSVYVFNDFNVFVSTPTALPTIYPLTSTAGKGDSHDHSVTVDVDKHSHSIDVIPPYYVLAFIIKL